MSGRHDGGQLTARVKAARGVRDDFEKAFRSALKSDVDLDWLAWATRLSSVLGEVLAILDGPQPAVTTLFPDGSAYLTVEDVLALVALARKLGGGR